LFGLSLDNYTTNMRLWHVHDDHQRPVSLTASLPRQLNRLYTVVQKTTPSFLYCNHFVYFRPTAVMFGICTLIEICNWNIIVNAPKVRFV